MSETAIIPYVATPEPRQSIPQSERRWGIRHDPAVIQAVAEHVENGLTYAQIAALPGMPSAASIERIISESDDLRALRACVNRVRAEGLIQEGLAIVDAPLPTDPRVASAEATRARNRAEFRRTMAGCLDRDTWGERPAVQVNVQNNVAVAFEKLVGKVDGE